MKLNPKNCRIAARMPKENPRPLNSPRSTTGEGDRRSTMMNQTMKTRPAAITTVTIVDVSPRSRARLIPKVRQASIPNSRIAPGTSRPLGRSWLGASLSRRHASTAAIRPNGTRVQKMARQSNRSINTPPRIGPAAAPAPTVETIRPNPVPRFEGGNAAVMIAAPLAIVIDAPMACSTREPTSSSREPEIADSSVATVKTT